MDEGIWGRCIGSMALVLVLARMIDLSFWYNYSPAECCNGFLVGSVLMRWTI